MMKKYIKISLVFIALKILSGDVCFAADLPLDLADVKNAVTDWISNNATVISYASIDTNAANNGPLDETIKLVQNAITAANNEPNANKKYYEVANILLSNDQVEIENLGGNVGDKIVSSGS